jgi:hypothetical protein
MDMVAVVAWIVRIIVLFVLLSEHICYFAMRFS